MMMIFCCGLNAPDFTEQSLSTLRCNGGRSPPSAINHSSILPLMALNSLYCADVPLSNYSLTHLWSEEKIIITDNWTSPLLFRIPSPVDIPGNEKADSAAKDGLSLLLH